MVNVKGLENVLQAIFRLKGLLTPQILVSRHFESSIPVLSCNPQRSLVIIGSFYLVDQPV